MTILDTLGQNIYPILAAGAVKFGIPVLLLLTCAKAESGLNPNAFRDGVWPDVSVGGYQQTVLYAQGYGVGDGCDTPENIALCQQVFSDWVTATDIAGTNLSGKYATALDDGFTGDQAMMEALSGYNSGSDQPLGSRWWSGPGEANYAAAMVWAKEQLGE